MPFIGVRSIIRPPSQMALPATLWPPPRTLTIRPCSRANVTALTTSPGGGAPRDQRRVAVDHAVEDVCARHRSRHRPAATAPRPGLPETPRWSHRRSPAPNGPALLEPSCSPILPERLRGMHPKRLSPHPSSLWPVPIPPCHTVTRTRPLARRVPADQHTRTSLILTPYRARRSDLRHTPGPPASSAVQT